MKVTEVASTLEGEVRLTDGSLVVFVEPNAVRCPEQACDREHHWLQGPTLRLCP